MTCKTWVNLNQTRWQALIERNETVFSLLAVSAYVAQSYVMLCYVPVQSFMQQ